MPWASTPRRDAASRPEGGTPPFTQPEVVLFCLRMVPGEANPNRRTQRRTVALALVMLATIVAVATVGVLDERALAARIREDLMREQSALAGLLADELRAGLARRDTGTNLAPQALLPAHASLENSLRRVLLWSDAAPALRTLQGPFSPHAAAATRSGSSTTFPHGVRSEPSAPAWRGQR